MGSFKDFVLSESTTNPLGLLKFEVKYDGKVLGTILAKDKKSALGKAKLKYFGKSGFSGNEVVKVELVKEDLSESFGPSKPIKVTVDYWDGSKPVIAYHYEKTPNMKGNGISYTKVLKLYWKIVKKGMNDPKHPHLDGVNDTKELWAEVIELDNKFKPYGMVMNQSVNDLKNELMSKMKVELSYRY